MLLAHDVPEAPGALHGGGPAVGEGVCALGRDLGLPPLGSVLILPVCDPRPPVRLERVHIVLLPRVLCLPHHRLGRRVRGALVLRPQQRRLVLLRGVGVVDGQGGVVALELALLARVDVVVELDAHVHEADAVPLGGQVALVLIGGRRGRLRQVVPPGANGQDLILVL